MHTGKLCILWYLVCSHLQATGTLPLGLVLVETLASQLSQSANAHVNSHFRPVCSQSAEARKAPFVFIINLQVRRPQPS